ncbi:MAG: Teichoic acids export ATP-binding protein TagH [Bacteroidetes bacterium ADurb.Bin174]|jgi:lipopolysaccharide transport system ATP-binding protein|nr:MAG: Teichoic acids export ATP-binding protein TagH [Bacteroidetes bacterium ADurb.Bin174]
MTAIEFENISKQYRLGLVSTRTLSHDLNRWWKMNILGKEDPYLKIGDVNDRASKGESEYVWALKDINFKVEQGDVLGIIGKNGAGKSTLLKILSKVTSPTTGTIKARGRIASLLEVGTGFHPEMTGRENIYMNGSIMGMTKAEITRKLDEIVDFAGVERYIDTPVKRYSSGMTVRLGFAIAAHLEPEILVVDEVLAVGDAEFQKKAIGKMQNVSKGEGRTVLFVSHNMGSLQSLCTSGLLLENGIIAYSGDIDNTIDMYLSKQDIKTEYVCEYMTKNSPCIQSIYLEDENQTKKNSFYHNEKINILISLRIKEFIPETYLLITILDKHKRKIFSAENKISKKMKLSISKDFLTRGLYSLQVVIYKPAVTQYDYLDDVCSFEVIDGGSYFSHLETYDYGCVFGSYEWIN